MPYRLSVAAALSSRGLARIYGGHFGIGIPEWRVIAMLGEFGRLTSRDIGEFSQMHKTMVSRAVRDLDRRGLVIRAENRDDRREAFVDLTEAGRQIYQRIVPLALAFEDRLMAEVGAADRAAFSRVLDLLTAAARPPAGTAGPPAD